MFNKPFPLCSLYLLIPSGGGGVAAGVDITGAGCCGEVDCETFTSFGAGAGAGADEL